MNLSPLGFPGDDEKLVTLDLSRSRPTDRLAAEDISTETAREMQAARLADLKQTLVWKVPLYFFGMAGLWVVYAVEYERPFKVLSLA